MTWLFIAVGTIAVVEAFFRLPLAPRLLDLKTLLGKIRTVLASSSISDHWKEKVLPRYAGQLFMLSIKLFVLCLLALSPMAIVAWIASLAEIPVAETLASWTGIIASTVLALAYIPLRSRFAAN